MFSDQQKREIFEEARNYLLESYKSYGITKEILDDQIAFPEQEKPKTKNKLFYKMIDHAQNRQGMPNAIGDINKLAPYLENFDAGAVLKKYRDWEILFDTLKREYHDAPGRMEKGNPHNYWVIYCKSIISIAKFVRRFATMGDFDSYVSRFITNTPDTQLALPLILKEEIFGYQFALACDFVKENIWPEFVKPDVHIRAIFIGTGMSAADSSDYRVFRDVIDYAASIGQSPYSVDKLFWLIGSGKFYRAGIKVPPKREKFIDHINQEYA